MDCDFPGELLENLDSVRLGGAVYSNRSFYCLLLREKLLSQLLIAITEAKSGAHYNNKILHRQVHIVNGRLVWTIQPKVSLNCRVRLRIFVEQSKDVRREVHTRPQRRARPTKHMAHQVLVVRPRIVGSSSYPSCRRPPGLTNDETHFSVPNPPHGRDQSVHLRIQQEMRGWSS